MKNDSWKWVIALWFLAALMLLLAGCTFAKPQLAGAAAASGRNEERLKEESRALTTGTVDALALAPSNAPTNLARQLSAANQQIQGMPAKRIDVPGLLADTPEARKSLSERLRLQEDLLGQRNALEAKLRESEARLIEMGKLYELERNQSTVKRFWKWLLATFGVGGVIALCILCPALIPILGQCLGWMVAKAPGLAGAFGIVSRKAFDSVVEAVGKFRGAMKATPAKEALDSELRETTEPHRKLIEARRAVLQVCLAGLLMIPGGCKKKPEAKEVSPAPAIERIVDGQTYRLIRPAEGGPGARDIEIWERLGTPTNRYVYMPITNGDKTVTFLRMHP